MEIKSLDSQAEALGCKIITKTMLDKLVEEAELGRRLLTVDYVRQQTQARTSSAAWIVFIPILVAVFLLTLLTGYYLY